MRIAFHSNQLGLRGTEVALYDYALFTQELLGHEAVILFPRAAPDNDQSAIQKFADVFKLEPYGDFADIDRHVLNVQADALYQIKYGINDGKLTRSTRNLIHAVFPCDPTHRHGEVYAYVSEWLSLHCTGGRFPYVPHIVRLPPPAGDFRTHLGIPKDAFVFGGYGGAESFNIAFVHRAVMQAVERRPDVWFLFMNFQPFCSHARVIFVKGTADIRVKAALVDTCDAMLHAREVGETFGIACGEFSIRNKPIVTYAQSPQAAHLHILGDRAITYSTEADALKILLDINHAFIARQNWDCYSHKFSAPPVMAAFNAVFLQAPSTAD